MLYSLKIDAKDLDVGMYVSELDRPWLETPFLTQGFLLETQKDIDRVREHCDYVYVDSLRSRQRLNVLLRKTRNVPSSPSQRVGGRARIPVEKIFRGREIKPYHDNASWREENPRASVALDSLVTDIAGVFEQVENRGTLDVVGLKKSLAPVIDSMGRNPDALLWLTRLKRHDRYSYQHSLSAAIWSVALGRQLGLQRLDLRSLAIGGILMDIGKIRVDQAVLQANRPLTEEETREIRNHVAHGVELLLDSGIVNQDIIDMVASHHERFDGSGYPDGLVGDQIPPCARIAAIVDTYDALTSNRSYAEAVSPSEAIRALYNGRDQEFQAELVEAFIQAVGIYPAGTIVELTTGEVGVVVAEYRTRRLQPKVAVLLDADKKPMETQRVVDLLVESSSQVGQPLRIARSLEPGAHGIQLEDLDPVLGALPGGAFV